jgi:hypothetical protein
MSLYRAIYQTKAGAIRRMTFAAPSIKEAYQVASNWELHDDKLQAVATVPARRPTFKLQAQLSTN